MQIGRRVMLRLLGLMGLGFLFRRLGTAEDVYATATPTPAPMQAVLNTGQTVRDTLYRLLREGGPWHKISDPNKDNTHDIHKTLDGWDHPSPPATYDVLATDLARITKDLDKVQVHPGHQHQPAKQCSGNGIARVRCELEAIDALVREHYNTLKDNNTSHPPPSLGPAPDPSLSDDKAIVELSSDITSVVNELATELETYHILTSKSPSPAADPESKGQDS
jgi:hypothetical protein